MPEGRIVAEKDGYVGRVIFDNVAKHNAVSRAMWDQLADAMADYDTDDDVRAVVLEGEGERAFVSGADISQFEDEHANLNATKAYSEAVAAAMARYSTRRSRQSQRFRDIASVAVSVSPFVPISEFVLIILVFAYPRRNLASAMDRTTQRSWSIWSALLLRRKFFIQPAASMRTKHA